MHMGFIRMQVRGNYSWLGWGWKGCSRSYHFPDEFNQDYGEPVGLCEETAPGVFRRQWTKGHATMDCNTWTGTVYPPVPATPLSLRTFLGGRAGADHAPCAARSGGTCSVFTDAGYELVRAEATVWSSPHLSVPAPPNNAIKRVDGIYDSAHDDNSLSDGTPSFTPKGFSNTSSYGETFYLFAGPGTYAGEPLVPVEVYYHAASTDHWVLASSASRTAAQTAGYTRVGTLGYARGA